MNVSSAPAIVRLDPRLDRIVPAKAALEKVANGFTWAEGPVWNRTGNYLLFSDVPNNRIVKWKAGEGTSVFLQPSRYSGTEPSRSSDIALLTERRILGFVGYKHLAPTERNQNPVISWRWVDSCAN